MYNEQVKQKRTKLPNAKVALDFTKALCSRDDNMFSKHTISDDGRHLENLFWCDGIRRMDYSAFGDVLAFDVTYRKVGYLCPIVVFFGVNHHNQSIVLLMLSLVMKQNKLMCGCLNHFW